MSKIHQPKVSMHAVPPLPGSAAPAVKVDTNAEVVAHARRRHFSNADKRRILAAADRCTKPGEIGALMRREGVYSSSLSTWRRQREVIELAALAPQRRGPKIDPARVDALQIAQLTRERDKLKVQLDKANLVIAVQKKVRCRSIAVSAAVGALHCIVVWRDVSCVAPRARSAAVGRVK